MSRFSTPAITEPNHPLAKHAALAIRSCNNTNMLPERTGTNIINQHIEDFNVLSAAIASKYPDRVGEFKETYEKWFVAWLHAKSNCISSAITGPARFPTKKAEKANETERRRYEEFRNAVERFGSWMDKQERRAAKREEGEVNMELRLARENLAKRQKSHETMKAANKIIRSKKLSDQEKTERLKVLGFTEVQALGLLTPDRWGGLGFAGYTLTNNNAQIKRLRARVAELEAKAAADPSENKVVSFEYKGYKGTITLNRSENRLQLITDEIPPKEMRQEMARGMALKWSRFHKVWQRKLTSNALWTVRHFLNLPQDVFK